MTWCKIDIAIHRNPKIRMAGRDAREVYIYLLLANAERRADGELPEIYVDPAYLADALQCTEEEACNGVKRCVTLHLLHVTEGVVRIVGWDSEWRTGGSADRVRKHRAKKKTKQKEPVNDDVTGCNVTGNTRNACNALDKSRVEKSRVDKDSRADALASAGVGKLNTLLVSNFSPTSKATTKLCEALARDGITPEDVELVVEHKFRDWRSDERMRKHLVPATLFANQNFHKYLDAARNAKTSRKPTPRRYQELT